MNTPDIAFLLGRLLLGGYFVHAGWNHFRNAKMLAGYAGMKKVPFPMAAILGTGVLLALGGLSILTGFYPYVGLGMLAIFLVGVTPKMHDYWNIKDPLARMGDRVNFLKNTALLGAVLSLAILGPTWPFALHL
jgi:putative oxidoreductase